MGHFASLCPNITPRWGGGAPGDWHEAIVSYAEWVQPGPDELLCQKKI